MKRLDPKDWSSFWKNQSITSFGNLFPQNYDGSILQFWQSQLDGDYEHVVDLACGNGALTWICDSILNATVQRTKVTGVDIAAIAPFQVLSRSPKDFPMITFIGNTPIEQLPFPDGSIDVFVSQYGLEYADLDRAIPELGRTLSPNGKVCFILHDRESTVIRGATEHLENFRTVLNDIRMHELAFELDRIHGKYRNPERRVASTEFQSVMQRIRAAAARVDDIARSHPESSPLHLYVRRLNSAFETRVRPNKRDRKKIITHARDSLASHIDRITDLHAAALSERGRERLVSLLDKEGLAIRDLFTLTYGSEPNIGTALVASR